MLVLTSETILKYFCAEGFAQSIHACFDLKVFENIFVWKDLLNPFMLVLSSDSILECLCPGGFAQSIHACFVLRIILECFCQEGFAHQSLKKIQLLRISI